ncbi:MAG: orotate phosphoribosyltransferase-like protein [Candidatus Poseidoniales archaeon]|nr:MAG: orotate phosphoribosyltransferase-like protein [Candidatus Poseidoniales archaeon]|tara:strand:- start:19 stop:600 length:582 start_codon:yes stop_codon:yes gene_type:complete
MHLSVDELRAKVEEFRLSGLNTQQIADELSLSQTTVQWLSASDFEVDDKPLDVKVGWRSIAVKGDRIEAVSYIFCDIIDEMVGDEIDTIVGVSINGIAFAQAISSTMDLEMAVVRSINEEVGGHLSEVYAGIDGKRVIIIDDVYSSGTTMKKTAADLKASGADVKMCMVLVNKSWDDDVDGVPLRALIRAATV